MTHSPKQSPAAGAREILAVRFGSLGDLCLLGWALARLADRPGGRDRRVTLVTKPQFASLLEHVRGVHRVIPLPDPGIGGLVQLAGHLRRTRWDLTIDAHNILRGHLLFGLMRLRPQRRLAKDTAARLAFLGLGLRNLALERTMHDRFEDLTAGLAPELPDETVSLPPLSSLAGNRGPETAPDILGLAPGAQWPSKRWPQEHFVSLLHEYLADGTGSVRVFLGPREESWFPAGPLEQAVRASDRTEIVRGRSLTEVAVLLAGCRRLVTNDSGLLHVAEAVGTPVLALFGPTVREFGYFPVLPSSRVLERDLDCRPCSRNGKRPCHRGDLACLQDIRPREVLAALNTMEDGS